jgi:predicted amidohydrolase
VAESGNLADLFAQIWLQLEQGEASNLHKAEGLQFRSGEIGEWRHKLDDMVLQANAAKSLKQWVREAPDCPFEIAARRVLAAQAIDRWYLPLAAAQKVSGSRSDNQIRAFARLTRDGRFNDEMQLGTVVLKRPIGGQFYDSDVLPPSRIKQASMWFQVSEFFDYVVRLPNHIEATDPDINDSPRSIALRYVFVRPELVRSTGQFVPVLGFAPIVERPDDLQIHVVNDSGKHWYDVRVNNLTDRIRAVTESLCKGGANIIIFPEMTMHPDAIDAVRDAIGTYGPRSNLRLVVAGTFRRDGGSGRPYNEAVIFNHRGIELGRQRKLHRWNLSAVQRNGIGLETAASDTEPLFEFITPGEEILVLEQHGFGRAVVLICEDLGRSEPNRWIRDNMFLDWIFTPILDRSIDAYRWMTTSSRQAAEQGLCNVVVANSLALSHRAKGELLRDPSGIGLCIRFDESVKFHVLEMPLAGPPDRSELVHWTAVGWGELL